MTYDEALAAIHGLEGRPWRLGLDRMRVLVERAGLTRALDSRGYVHIAGTNGKGTTTAFVESILRYQGWRTGAFYSPYVVDYRERIQSGGELISKTDLAVLVERLLPIADSMSETEYGGATKFEFEAALGLAYWEKKRCDWVALEVGLGGRLDATNVVTPRACAIVSIGLDHTAILGNTLAEIAVEKAGIIKPGVPVVVGFMASEPLAVIERIANERGAPLWRVGEEVRFEQSKEWIEVQTPLGTFGGQDFGFRIGGVTGLHNAAVAVAACVAGGAILGAGSITRAIGEAWLPGRYDRRLIGGREVVFDGAHNDDAARAIVSPLGPPIVLVTNMVAGHEVEPFYRRFATRAVRAEVAPIDSPRALPVEETVRHLQALDIPATGHSSVAEALAAALADDDGEVMVTGSNYLVGEALRSLEKS